MSEILIVVVKSSVTYGSIDFGEEAKMWVEYLGNMRNMGSRVPDVIV